MPTARVRKVLRMERDAARVLAVELMTEHGLTDAGWRFRFNPRMLYRAGQILYGPRVIELGTDHVDLNEVGEVRDTILHEIAHQKAGSVHGHDEVWKAWARRLGARPFARKGPDVVGPAYRWVASCCGNRVGWYGKPRVAWRCAECGVPLEIVRA